MTHELIEAEIVETLPIKRGKQEIVPIQQDDAEDDIKYLAVAELNWLYRRTWTPKTEILGHFGKGYF